MYSEGILFDLGMVLFLGFFAALAMKKIKPVCHYRLYVGWPADRSQCTWNYQRYEYSKYFVGAGYRFSYVLSWN